LGYFLTTFGIYLVLQSTPTPVNEVARYSKIAPWLTLQGGGEHFFVMKEGVRV